MNLGTALVLTGLIFIVGGIIFRMRKNKGTCGCGCSNCSSAKICHKNK